MERTLAHIMYADYRRLADRPCAAVKRDGRYVRLSYREVERRVASAVLQLLELGVKPGDRIAIISPTRLEWMIADHAIALAGAVVVPIYPTLPADMMELLLKDSSASVAIVEGPREAERIRQAAGPGLRIVSMEDCPTELGATRMAAHAGAADLDEPRIASRLAEIKEGSLISFLYTSGTTGRPKGVLYDHARVVGALAILCANLGLREDDVALSFLPMSHALGRASPTAYFHAGIVNCFAESLDTVAEDFRLARPTVAFTVPRVFEKAYERIITQLRSGSAVKQRLFEWALATSREAYRARAAGRPPGLALGVQRAIADRLVFTKIRERLGGRVRVLWSAGASLAAHLAEFFNLVGIPIRDVYGMSEFGLSHMTPEDEVRFGSCGRVARGFEARIAPDGELLVRTKDAMLRYHGLPEDTAAFRDPEGWMHTGDVGYEDADGFLFITDRKKSLIVLSNGKKVAPSPIEQRLLEASPLVAQAVVVGEGRNYLVALIHPNPELVAARGLDEAAVREELQRAVDAANRGQASFETVKRFALLERPLTEADGDLTPSLKLKRSVVSRKNAALIDRLYLDEGT